MQHLEEGTIHAWLDGALSGDEQAHVEQHVQQCAECAAMVAEARGMIAGAARIVQALDIVPGGVIPKQRAPAATSGSLWRTLRLTPFRAALAASLMIAAASLVTVRHDESRDSKMASADSIAFVAPVTAAAPSAPSAAPSPAIGNTQGPTSALAEARTRADAPTAGVGTARVPAVAKAQVPMVENAQLPIAVSPPVLLERRADAARPAPQPVSGVVADAAKKLDSVSAPRLALGQVVVTAASAAPPAVAASDVRRSAQGALRDSMVANAAKAAAPVSARDLASQRGAGMEPDRRRLMANETSLDVAGCYQVSRDSSPAFVALPERFALERLQVAGPARSVVYAIDSAGRVDSTVVGTWRDVSANAIVVNLAAGTRQPLTLAKTVAGFTVQPVSSFAPSPPVRIVRTTCPR